VVVRVPPNERSGPGAGRPESIKQDERLAGGRSVVMVMPEPRWCRFAAVFCRCGVEHIETATMSVCVRHYLDHEAVSA
jgi:hypothetical protein